MSDKQAISDDDRELTFGEKAVGLTFNPSGDEKVTKLKKLYAEIINILHEDRGKHRDERARHASVAITDAETGQMRAVKAVTFTRDEQAEQGGRVAPDTLQEDASGNVTPKHTPAEQ